MALLGKRGLPRERRVGREGLTDARRTVSAGLYQPRVPWVTNAESAASSFGVHVEILARFQSGYEVV